MTPNDKYNELITKCLSTFGRLTIEEAKKAALIVVNEMIEEHNLITHTDIEMKRFYINYWEKVKQAINKL
jgi:hypothetical protein